VLYAFTTKTDGTLTLIEQHQVFTLRSSAQAARLHRSDWLPP